MFRKAYILCLSLVLLYILEPNYKAFSYEIDSPNYTLTVSPTKSPQTTTDDLQKAFSYLASRKDTQNRWTLSLNPGQYYLTKQIGIRGLQNTVITSSDLTKPAQLIKVSGWDDKNGDYILAFRMAKMVHLIGIEFYGHTDFAKGPNPDWGDQGVYLGSCQIIKVDKNKFYNFGNAALRVVTDARDPVQGVNSFKTQVSNNIFNNIYQTATTSTDPSHGGTAQSTWSKNTFINLRGSVKFASRTPGGRQIEFINNIINNSDHFGLEIVNYSDFLIKGNTMQNIKEHAITLYTDGDPTIMKKGFAWGDNITISSNVIKNVGYGIRYSHKPFFDGTQNTPKNLVIDNNIIDTVTTSTSYIPAIQITGSSVDGLQVSNNKMSNIRNSNYLKLPEDSNITLIKNNLINGKADELIPMAKK